MKTITWPRAATPALLTGFIFLTFLSSGCSVTSGFEATGRSVIKDGVQELDKNIIINNRGLASDLEISDMKSVLTGDLLRVQVSLRSRSRDTVPVQYRFEWFDAQGFEINANEAWKPFLIYGHETRTLQGVAPDQRAKEFKLKLRDPDTGD